MRRHDWICDMLSDLRDYAMANGLPDLASSVEVTLTIARRETDRAHPDRERRLCRREPRH